MANEWVVTVWWRDEGVSLYHTFAKNQDEAENNILDNMSGTQLDHVLSFVAEEKETA